MDHLTIDAFEFCQRKENCNGEIPIAELSRLTQDCADSSGVLRWTLSGQINTVGHAQMTLSVSAQVQLMCQRCLTQFSFDVTTKSQMILALDEETADQIEASLDDDSIDVIVGSKSFDVVCLIEDEVLLALPLSPRHVTCPSGQATEVNDNKKESPFAILKNLKH